MKKLMILGAQGVNVPVVKKAKSMGLYVCLVDINPSSPAIKYADEYHKVSLKDKEAVLKLAKEVKPDGIIVGTCDTAVQTAAYVCTQLGLIGQTEKAAKTATDKLEMLYAFERNNVAHPKFQVVKKNDVANFKTDIPFPVISKPVDSAGSRGVNYIADESQLKTAVLSSSKAGGSGDVLVEEYMSGTEVSVEVLIVGCEPYVLQITDKITTGAPHFCEVGHSQPSTLPTDIKKSISDLAKQAVRAVGLVNGAAHVEIMYTDDGPKMVELGGRMGGGYTTSYLLENSVSGVNMIESVIRMSLGEELPTPNYENSGTAVVVRFLTSQNGTVKSITGLEEVKALTSTIDANVFLKIGDKCTVKESNDDRIGYVVSKGKTTKEAMQISQRGLDEINVEYK